MAKQLDEPEVAQLLQQTLDEEVTMAKQVAVAVKDESNRATTA